MRLPFPACSLSAKLTQKGVNYVAGSRRGMTAGFWFAPAKHLAS
jgi:hypothetical protein